MAREIAGKKVLGWDCGRTFSPPIRPDGKAPGRERHPVEVILPESRSAEGSRGLMSIHAASNASVSGCHTIVVGSSIDPLIA